MKDNWVRTLLSIFISLLIASLPWWSLADDMTCSDLNPAQTYDLSRDPSEKRSLLVVYEHGAQNNSIYIYLKAKSKCRVVLSTWGRSIEFQESKDSPYPDVKVYWHHGAGKNPPVNHYIWAGNRYVDAQQSKSENLNKEALKLFNQGKIHEAIELWQQAVKLAIIPGLGYTSNAEALNNLGFAYYKLATKSKSNEHFELARTYFEQSIAVDPRRWVTYLNLGDLCAARGCPEQAIENYKKLLELNPNYKNADKIRVKIKDLTGKIKAK